MASMATSSKSGASQTLKMTGHQINDMVDQEVSSTMEDGALKDKVQRAIFEIFCIKGNFMINSSTLQELKKLALTMLKGEGVPDEINRRVLAIYDRVFREHSLPPASQAQRQE